VAEALVGFVWSQTPTEELIVPQPTSNAKHDAAADGGAHRGAPARRLLATFLAVSGFVPGHATLARVAVMSASAALVYYLAHSRAGDQTLAIGYALGSILCYVGFIFVVLRQNGLRHWFIKRWGEAHGYLAFEATLAFLFFHNAAAIGYVATSSPGTMFSFIPRAVVVALATALFVVGIVTKLWAAMAVSVDIYYWKDMFLGRGVCAFVETGPYKYLSAPMYGVGQLQAYAIAIWFGSPTGLAIAALNQCCVFLFYFAVEQGFIRRTYVQGTGAAAA